MSAKAKKAIPHATENKEPRPPIVVIMGHVDHGKTTLLDYIRSTNVAAKEAGGITQHIGAYEIAYSPRDAEARAENHASHQKSNADKKQRAKQQKSPSVADKKITFIDTPGHEAFSKMRSRGAKVADVAILVIAADEGVKPQTKEAILHINESETPMIVALNKMDRPGADPARVKQELASSGVLVEGWGGDVPIAEISAKTGQGVEALLELVLLMAEMESLVADPLVTAEGIVIESQLDQKRGPVATLLIQKGTLKKGETVLAGSALAKIKLIENFEGKPVNEAGPSTPVRILGWEKLPQVGDVFKANTRQETQQLTTNESLSITPPIEKKTGDLILIIKAGATGSLEALGECILALKKSDLEIIILSSGPGEITESDVKLARASGAIIIGFQARLSREAETFIKQNPCKIIGSNIIYELLDELQKEINRIVESKTTAKLRGKMEVLATFGSKNTKQVIGGRVTEGTLIKRMVVKIVRRDVEIGKARILNLQKNKHDIDKLELGEECGLLVDSPISVIKGDLLVEIRDEKA